MVDKKSQVVRASIATFGENIGVIMQDVFDLDDGSTDWHATVQQLAYEFSLDEIEDMFERRLGFGPRSYTVSRERNGFS